MSSRSIVAVVILAAGLAACAPPNAATPATRGVDTARILRADEEPGNWLTHGRTYGEQRFSPLTSITTENASRLGLAWSYDLGMNRGAEATPIVVDGVMYATSAWSIVHAIDAATGARRWVYDPQVSREAGPKACCDVVNRGVAVYGQHVFVGTIDGRLVAIDAGTGARAWEVVTVDQSQPYTITGAPRAANGLVYIGNGGAEFGVRGYVSAYDTETGALRWRFYTVPGDPAKGPDRAASDPVMGRATTTWNGQWWTHGGGGTVWDAIVYDAEFDQLIVGVGNGSPWNREVRSPGGGDNLFLSSILALDATRGAYKWHYQTTPGDSWDYTATQPIVLADLSIGGRTRKVAMQAPKNGFFYVVDRADGTLVSAMPYLDMRPAKDTPPGAPLAWAYAIDQASGRPIENPGARYEKGPALVHPGPDGGHNWHPMSYSPQTGLVYVPTQDSAILLAPHPAFTRYEGFLNLGVMIGGFPDDPQVRKAIRNGGMGHAARVGPRGTEGSVAGEAARRVQRRHARDRRRYRLPGHGRRAVRRDGRAVRQGALGVRQPGGDARRSDQLCGGRRAVHRRGRRLWLIVFPHQRLLRAQGGCAHQRTHLCVQARRRGREAVHRIRTDTHRAAADASGDACRVPEGHGPLRPVLPRMPWHRGDLRGRATRPAEVRPPAGSGALESRCCRRGTRLSWHAPLWPLHHRRRCRTGARLRGTAGSHALRRGADPRANRATSGAAAARGQ